jgi:hypothetical protein
MNPCAPDRWRSLLVVCAAALGALSGCRSATDNQTRPAACSINPCNEANRNRCVEEGGVSRCVCNAGYVARPGGACEEVSSANCPEHSGDPAEPDDCTSRARSLPMGKSTIAQTIDPAGDYDFARFEGKEGTIYELTVQGSGTLMPRIDAFDQGGQWLGSEEKQTKAVLRLKSRVTAQVFARVSHSPVDPSIGTGGYTLSLAELGLEDHSDVPAAATALAPSDASAGLPPVVRGKLELSGDQDWFTFTGLTSQSYRLTFDPTEVVPQVALHAGADSTSPRWTVQQSVTDFEVPANEALFLRISDPGAVGDYSFTLVRTQK